MASTQTTTVSTVDRRDRLMWLKRTMWCLLLLLFCRVMFLIVAEYRNYFPPNFNSDFLIGREDRFYGVYSVAFYIHILTSPIALLASAFLMATGTLKKFAGRWRGVHRSIGKLQVILILVAVTPTGIVMSTQANTGPVAGTAFLLLSIGTAVTALAAAWFARAREIGTHRLWATRCFLLLCSPLLLRLTQGAVDTFHGDTQWSYPLAAWSSWTVPLILFELQRHPILQRKLSHETQS